MKKHPPTSYILFIILICSFSLHAADLSFDMATGKVQGFDLSQVDSTTNIPSNIWNAYGYVGRIVYNGPATALTFTQTAPIAIGTPNPPKFYFSYLLAGGAFQREVWSEFTMVGKLRGTRHSSPNSHIDITTQPPQPIFIDVNGGTMSILSAGSETWQRSDANVPGFDENGNPGTKTRNSTKYQYKYQYSSIWVDLIILRRNQAQQASIPNGFYETNFSISTGSNAGGLVVPMTLHGEKTTGTVQNFLFRVESVASSPFPYQGLITKNSTNNTLKVGEVSFLYDTLSFLPNPPTIKLASNSGGTASNFSLTSPGVPPIPFGVVFDSVLPAAGRTHVNSSNITFNSLRTQQISPIDGRTSYSYALNGDVHIFVPTDTMPLSGIYSSTIYCILSAF